MSCYWISTSQTSCMLCTVLTGLWPHRSLPVSRLRSAWRTQWACCQNNARTWARLSLTCRTTTSLSPSQSGESRVALPESNLIKRLFNYLIARYVFIWIVKETFLFQVRLARPRWRLKMFSAATSLWCGVVTVAVTSSVIQFWLADILSANFWLVDDDFTYYFLSFHSNVVCYLVRNGWLFYLLFYAN